MATPLAPVGLTPSGGYVVTVSQTNTFTWQSDTAQAAFYIQYKQVDSSTVSFTGWQTSSVAQYVFPAYTFTNTYAYAWRVKIRNNAGQESTYSDWAIFRAGYSSFLTITNPSADFEQEFELPTYTHVLNTPDGQPQASCQYEVFTALTWDDFDAMTAAQQEAKTYDKLEIGSDIWDSGVIVGDTTSVEQPPGYLLAGTPWYKVQCTAWDATGTEYSSDVRTFQIIINSIPKVPTITAAADSANGQNIVTITNPTPDPGQVAADFNRLYRKQLDGTWELVEDNITGGVGYDTTCRADTEEYAATAVAYDSGNTTYVESGRSTSATATCALTSFWFTNLTTNVTVELRLQPKWGRMQSERKRDEIFSLDAAYPTVLYGPQRFYRGSFQALVLESTTQSWPDYVESIRAVLDPVTPAHVLMRTMFGDLFEISPYDFQMDLFDRMDQGRTIAFNFIEIEEMVAPGTYTYDLPTVADLAKSYWVLDPATGKGFELYASPRWGATKTERDRMENLGLNAEFATVKHGNKRCRRGGFTGLILAPETGSLAEEVMKLRELLDPVDKKPVVFRTPSGDSFLVDTYGFSFEMFDRFNQGRVVSFEYVEIGEV